VLNWRRNGSKSVPALAADAAHDAVRLASTEVELLKARFSETLRQARIAIGMLAGAAVVAFLAFTGLLVTIGLALGLVLPGWAAALVVVIGLALIGAVLAVLGRAGLRRAAAARVTGPAKVETDAQDTRYRLEAEPEALAERLDPRRLVHLPARKNRS
jgi:hypothetical protein